MAVGRPEIVTTGYDSGVSPARNYSWRSKSGAKGEAAVEIDADWEIRS
jgi:hypothetical protein